MRGLSEHQPVTLSLGDQSGDRPEWIDCVLRDTQESVALLAPQGPLSSRLAGRLSAPEPAYITFEERGTPVALRGMAVASSDGATVAFLVVDPREDEAPQPPRERTEAETVFRLMYISQAAPDLTNRDFEAILREASARNEGAAITGALCLRDGFFGQILEGSELAVRRAFMAIERDPRHTNPVIVREERASERLYGGWAMKGIQGENAITAADELAARVNLAKRRDTAALTRRWIELLRAQAAPAWTHDWLASRQSVLMLRELIEQTAPRAGAH